MKYLCVFFFTLKFFISNLHKYCKSDRNSLGMKMKEKIRAFKYEIINKWVRSWLFIVSKLALEASKLIFVKLTGV